MVWNFILQIVNQPSLNRGPIFNLLYKKSVSKRTTLVRSVSSGSSCLFTKQWLFPGTSQSVSGSAES